MKCIFTQHGSFELHINGNILVANLHGGWNLEAAQSFSDAFKLKAARLTHDSWGHLVFLDDWDTGIPGVNTIIIDLVTWCIENNLRRAAHVYRPSTFKQQYVDSVVVEHLGQFTRQAYDNTEAAITWLSEQGYSLSNKDAVIPMNLTLARAQ